MTEIASTLFLLAGGAFAALGWRWQHRARAMRRDAFAAYDRAIAAFNVANATLDVAIAKLRKPDEDA